ncbi:MAG: helix-turn-helix domain-containing protein [Clostridia bacterium]|nr:helix-turn-helix domain-containing protein [Clostridia bacterium]
MDRYVTGAFIKKLREEKKMTQSQLAEKLCVSDKAVSKWETGRGYPDVTLLEPIAAALGVSVIELFSGADISNNNRSFNMKKLAFYVCPVCGNVIAAAGEALIGCCGVTLLSEAPEAPDEEHLPTVEKVEDEYFVSVPHEMSKRHYISFIAAVRDNGYELAKLYPEGEACARFKINRTAFFCYYCNRHGLFKIKAE